MFGVCEWIQIIFKFPPDLGTEKEKRRDGERGVRKLLVSLSRSGFLYNDPTVTQLLSANWNKHFCQFLSVYFSPFFSFAFFLLLHTKKSIQSESAFNLHGTVPPLPVSLSLSLSLLFSCAFSKYCGQVEDLRLVVLQRHLRIFSEKQQSFCAVVSNTDLCKSSQI